MKETKTTEYLKYVFTEDEKREIASSLAENVNNLQRVEEEKKAVMSDFKSQIDGLSAKTNNLATKLSNGYEFRHIECTVTPNLENKEWVTVRNDTGEVVNTRKMTSEDLQNDLPFPG